MEVRIRYVLPPASFEKSGQKVRGPSEILERRLGTCLDTSLFYAACLEQAGLQPLIVLTDGPRFCRSLVQSGSVVGFDDR